MQMSQQDGEKIYERPQSQGSSKVMPIAGIIATGILLLFLMNVMGPGSRFNTGWKFYSSQHSPSQQSNIMRLDQTDQAQYASLQEYTTWSGSSCSAAAIAYVFNTYGGHYTIHDILTTEIQLQQISPTDGMLNGFTSIQQTVNLFGYHALPVLGGVDGIVNMANGGTPVIVSMANSSWPKGHIIVVTGGDSTSVQVVDSWTSNKTSIDRIDFAAQWTGLSVIVKPGVSQ